MGTSAMIGILEDDGTVTASYCHYDGYAEGVGRTLRTSYDTTYDAQIVTRGGYLSSLDADYYVSRTNSVHADNAVKYSSVMDYLTAGGNHGAEYLYLYDSFDGWLISGCYDKSARFEQVDVYL